MGSSTQAVKESKSVKYRDAKIRYRSYADVDMFQGARRDADNGVGYGDARNCDPITGTWNSRDPGGFEMGDVNLYRAVGNALTDGVDPNGLQEQQNKPEDLKELEKAIKKLAAKSEEVRESLRKVSYYAKKYDDLYKQTYGRGTWSRIRYNLEYGTDKDVLDNALSIYKSNQEYYSKRAMEADEEMQKIMKRFKVPPNR
jgi:RHS repeat-associated protein